MENFIFPFFFYSYSFKMFPNWLSGNKTISCTPWHQAFRARSSPCQSGEKVASFYLIFIILRQLSLLSYGVAVIQWITLCHKTMRVITLWRVYVTSLTTSVSAMRFLYENMFTLKAIKYHCKRSYEKHNITLVVR